MNEDRSTRYHRLRRRGNLFSVVMKVMLLLGVLGLGLSPLFRDRSADIAIVLGGPKVLRSSTEVAIYAVMLAILAEAVALPANWYTEWILDRRYGLSRDRLRTWIVRRVTTTFLCVLVCALAAVFVYVAVRSWPTSWWMMAGIFFSAWTITLTHVAPVLILPWFYHFRPLAQRPLRARLESLTRRVGAPVTKILEWQLGQNTPRPNATLVGIGRTRQVLLTDTLLAEYSDDEIEVVLAHELGHHVHRDIWRTVAYEAVAATLVFGAAHWVVGWASGFLGIESQSDVAGLPLGVLTAGVVVMLLAPVTNSLSRSHEKRADEYALEVTGNPGAFVSVLRRVSAQHLAEDRPSRLVKWFFYLHPPLSDRLASVRTGCPSV